MKLNFLFVGLLFSALSFAQDDKQMPSQHENAFFELETAMDSISYALGALFHKVHWIMKQELFQ